jgi:hypothetical protein
MKIGNENQQGLRIIGIILFIWYLLLNILILISGTIITNLLMLYDLLFFLFIIIICFLLPIFLSLKDKINMDKHHIKINKWHINWVFINSFNFFSITIFLILIWFIWDFQLTYLFLIIILLLVSGVCILFSPIFIKINDNKIYVRSLLKYNKNKIKNEEKIKFFLNPKEININNIEFAQFINDTGFKTILFKLKNSYEVEISFIDKTIWLGMEQCLKMYNVKIKN